MKVTPLENLRYMVQSESDPKVEYLVDVLAGRCSCPNFVCRIRKPPGRCKHLTATLLVFAEEMLEKIRKHPNEVKERNGP